MERLGVWLWVWLQLAKSSYCDVKFAIYSGEGMVFMLPTALSNHHYKVTLLIIKFTSWGSLCSSMNIMCC